MDAWRIYYADGSTFDSSRGDPGDVPAEGVVCIAFAEKDLADPRSVGRRVLYNADFYIWRKDVGEWWGVDHRGVISQAKFYLGHLGAVLEAHSVPNDIFKKIHERAKTEPGLPPKSGTRRDEKGGQWYGEAKID